MRLFRSREMKGLTLACLLLTAALAALGFFLEPRFGWFALAVCGGVSGAAIAGYGLHLLRLEKLTLSMQRVLRGEGTIPLSQNREGEYAIFEHELYKLSQALRTQVEASQADKRQLADALADISHQIKTPLTAMTLECQLLRAPEMEVSQRLRLARDLDGQLQRVERLVGMLLKMSRMDAGMAVFRPESWTADALIDQALSPLLIPLELREIALRRSGKAEDSLRCDESWTVEALGSILKNCMEHTPAGGEIVLTHQETPVYTRIQIRNSGAPIAQEELPHIFERFYRGKNATPGSAGIGLAFARQVIARQQGSLTARNTPDGPEFTVTIYKHIV
mgnify:FL=1